MMSIDTIPRRETDEARRPYEAVGEAKRAPSKAAEDSERLVDIICAMMAERSTSGA